jgi:hypothetical protein
VNLNGEKIKSCWTVNKLGICVVYKIKQKEWENRIETLFRVVDYWMKNIPCERFPIDEDQYLVLEIVELFFS